MKLIQRKLSCNFVFYENLKHIQNIRPHSRITKYLQNGWDSILFYKVKIIPKFGKGGGGEKERNSRKKEIFINLFIKHTLIWRNLRKYYLNTRKYSNLKKKKVYDPVLLYKNKIHKYSNPETVLVFGQSSINLYLFLLKILF